MQCEARCGVDEWHLGLRGIGARWKSIAILGVSVQIERSAYFSAAFLRLHGR